jgi:hypothetical protein
MKGIVLNTSKVLLGVIPALILGRLLGQHSTWLGLTPLALISAMSNSNGWLYAALASRYGDDSDVGAVEVISSSDGPFFEMAFMAGTGWANIPCSMREACDRIKRERVLAIARVPLAIVGACPYRPTPPGQWLPIPAIPPAPFPFLPSPYIFFWPTLIRR